MIIRDGDASIRAQWSDGKKWLMGIVGTVVAAALVAPVGSWLHDEEPIGKSDGAVALRAAESLAAMWFEAFEAEDLATLVELSPPPFFFRDRLEVTGTGIRRLYEDVLKEDDFQGITFESLSASLVSEWDDSLGGVPERPALRPTDIVVQVELTSRHGGRESGVFLVRRTVDGVELAGCPIGSAAPVAVQEQ